MFDIILTKVYFFVFHFQAPIYFDFDGGWLDFNNLMLAFPHECRRNYNCAEAEKVAVNSNIPTYQFAIIKLAVKLSMERKLEIKYQLALRFPGKLFFSW